MNARDTLEKAIAHAGGVSALATMLGITHANVCKWRAGNRVPAKHRIQIEELTNGEIRAVDWKESA